METNDLGCINPDSQIPRAKIFVRFVPNICEISVWNLSHPLAPTILMWPLKFCKICGTITLKFEFISTQEFVA